MENCGQKYKHRNIKELEKAVNKFYSDDNNFGSDYDSDTNSLSGFQLEKRIKLDHEQQIRCITPLHVAAGTGRYSLWETLMQITTGSKFSERFFHSKYTYTGQRRR